MKPEKVIPNFLVIGAPKCGTTALCQYLADHPEICFSDTKEPNYFCADFPGFQNSHSIEEYLAKEFSHCNTEQFSAIGEGSVWYLYSKTAVSKILNFNPEMKFIVMLRKPSEVVQSLHSQMLCNLDENVLDFETAWYLQETRATGQHIPPLCREAKFLQYRDIAKFGEQLSRLFAQVPSKHIKVILFDDFVQNTRQTYVEILEFIGVHDDDRILFPKVNENKALKSRWVARIIHRPPKFVTRVTKWAKWISGIHRFGLYRFIANIADRFNTKKTKRGTLSVSLQESIARQFSDDITKLEMLIERDLSTWRQ